ncbi:hypothetical protein KIS4809_3242 [Bacillus sp. ZZV12-4809]|nr:hypothetical protein KIS4809_3242 [Bacillus sp. ZZV12-4809]
MARDFEVGPYYLQTQSQLKKNSSTALIGRLLFLHELRF